MSQILNPFGKTIDGRIIHVEELSSDQSGEKCNCVCPQCGDILIARLGSKRVKHFAHKTNKLCKFGSESGLHLFAKKAILSSDKLKLPSIDFRIGPHVYNKEERYINYLPGEITEETTVEDLRPDILIDNGIEKLLVEIRVSHRVPGNKIHKLRENGLNTIEIDLSSLDRNSIKNPEKLKKLIIEMTRIKTWLYNRELEEAQRNFIRLIKEEADKKKEKDESLEEYKKKKAKEAEKFIEEQKNSGNPMLLFNEKNSILNDSNWKLANRFLKLDPDNLPEYLNHPIEGEMVFQCDRRIWQTYLFSVFLHKFKERGLQKYFSVKGVIAYLERESKDMFSFMDLLKYNSIKPNGSSGLSSVIADYFVNLEKFGIVEGIKINTRKEHNKYYWSFEKIKDHIEEEKIKDDERRLQMFRDKTKAKVRLNNGRTASVYILHQGVDINELPKEALESNMLFVDGLLVDIRNGDILKHEIIDIK